MRVAYLLRHRDAPEDAHAGILSPRCQLWGAADAVAELPRDLDVALLPTARHGHDQGPAEACGRVEPRRAGRAIDHHEDQGGTTTFVS